MNRFAAVLLLAGSAFCFAQAPQIKSGSTVFIEPMDGYETYLAAAFAKKGVPLVIVSDKDKADYIIKGTVKHIQPTGPTTVVNQTTNVGNGSNDAWDRGSEIAQRSEARRAAFGYYITGITVIDPESSRIVFADSESRMSTIAKHLKKFIEKSEKSKK